MAKLRTVTIEVVFWLLLISLGAMVWFFSLRSD
jgi:hypothetical protein